MPKAYSYIRMSTETQAQKGESFRRQVELSEKYAKEEGLTIEKAKFLDLGVSAYKGTQVASGALGKFMKSVEDGEIEEGSYLLVESLDRLSRQAITVAATQFLRLIDAGIIVVTLIDNIVYSKATLDGPTAMSMLIISLSIMHRAHDESETKSRRISSAWEAKRQNIAKEKISETAPLWLKLSSDRTYFHVLEDRAEMVRQMFEDSKNGIGTVTIASKLNKAKIAPWGRSQGWRQSYIKKILDSDSVRGIFEPTKLINKQRTNLLPVPDYYPRIVSDELFYAAQASRRSRKANGGRRGATYSNLFTHIAKCGYCDSSVRMLNSGWRRNGPGHRYLRCDAAIRSYGNCTAARWRYDDFEANFLSLVSEIDIAQFVDSKSEASKLRDLRVIDTALVNRAL